MKTAMLFLGLSFALSIPARLAAADDSEEDLFGQDEEITVVAEETQKAAPRDELLSSSAPWLTGSFTGSVGLDWRWSDVWGESFDLLAPTAYGLGQSATSVKLGFVARPATNISVSGQLRSSYPFVEQIASDGRTVTVPDFTVWSLYSRFSWQDRLFFTFGKQPIRWGTGTFFSPANDVFAQSEVDIEDPTAERAGPLALKLQYPIPLTMSSLYLFAVLPRSSDAAALASLKPQDVAVALKAELLLGNTELAAAGYYQRERRPELMLMATTGTGDLSLFGEAVLAFASPRSEPFIEVGAASWGPFFHSDYSVVDRGAEATASATAGAMYANADWHFTAVGQYLYNGHGYGGISLGEILRAVMDRALGQPEGEPKLDLASFVSSMSGLGRIGRHYAVLSVGWSSLWSSTWGLSLLAVANLSDLSGYVRPTLSVTCFDHIRLSGSVSFSWGAEGTEFADPAGLLGALAAGNLAYAARPSMSLSLTASVGSTSF